MATGKLSQAYKKSINQRRYSARFLTSIGVVLSFLFSSAAFAQSDPLANILDAGQEDYHNIFNLQGIEALRSIVKNRDDANSLAYRAKLALIDGDLKLAESLGEQAFELSKLIKPPLVREETRAAAAIYYARALKANYKLKKAEEVLRTVLNEAPKQHEVRVELGEFLIAKGSKSEAKVVLNVLAGFFNKKLMKTSRDFTAVSRGMQLTGSHKDANYAMERAIEKNAKNVDGLIHWGYLFLEKYNRGDALNVFKEALAANPNSVGAMIGVARTELELGNDYAKVREILARAQELSPNDVDLHLVYADIAIKDTDCKEARRQTALILKNRPKHLEALTINATCAYLDDDMSAFERQAADILKLNPDYAELYTTAATYGVRVHRYKEGVALHRRALKINPDFGPALLGIGIGLSRTGDERGAHDMLKRAFEVDPFNVRVFNMLELYETELENYEIKKYPKFELRTKKTESEVINAVVAPLVEESILTYDKTYNFKPEKYLSVEVFPESQVFGVRSVGLPNISPQGVCFGNTVIARSPSDGNFNWAQVIWHEMAHVYHIQLSQNRVPRWFTEGLAEYETNIKDTGWARYHDRELSKALKSGELRGVLNLSKGFTHARSHGEILRSYHQASLVIHFIAETYSYEKLPEMLRAWAAKKRTPQVLKDVLGLDADAFDAGFEKWLTKKYFKFGSQFSVDLDSLQTSVSLKDALVKSPNDEKLWAKLAIAKMRAGDVRGADLALEKAIELGPKTPEVNLIATYYYYGGNRFRDAYEHGNYVLNATQDSYDLRFVLGSAAQKIEKDKEAELHFWAATQLWPDGVDAWKALARIYKKSKRVELYEGALERLFALQHHSPNLARQYAEYWSKKKNWKKVEAASKRWFEINPFDVRAYQFSAESNLHLKKLDLAKKAWELWSIVKQSDKQKRILSAIEVLTKTGYKDEAKEKASEAREMKIPESKIKKALTP